MEATMRSLTRLEYRQFPLDKPALAHHSLEHLFHVFETFFKTPCGRAQARTPSKEEIRMQRLGLRATAARARRGSRGRRRTLAATATARSQATTITFWQTMNDQETVTAEEPRQPVRGSHPDIKIDMVTVPFDQHAQKFTTAAQAGQAPDVMRADTAPDVQGWAAQGLLTDLTSMISASRQGRLRPGGLQGRRSTTGRSTPSRRPSTRSRSSTTRRCSRRRASRRRRRRWPSS